MPRALVRDDLRFGQIAFLPEDPACLSNIDLTNQKKINMFFFCLQLANS